ncbi:MAG: hypothetical protein RMJ67_01145 [Elusimicrobiota bacterium]|nr:hypothetical protein [Endomicrobiia bacterium]MDW8165109.1 hypothetical protein [Elusimicrobiota bacterium]
MKILSISKQGLLSVVLATKNIIINTKLNRNYRRARYVYSIFERNQRRKLKFEYYFTTPANNDTYSVRQFETRDYIYLPKGYDFKLEKSTNGETELDVLFEDVEIDNKNNAFDYIEFNNYELLQNEDYRKYTVYFKAGYVCLVKGFWLYNIKDVDISISGKIVQDGFTVSNYNDASIRKRVYDSYFELEEIPYDYVYFPTDIILEKDEYLRFIPHSPKPYTGFNFFVAVEYEVLQ